MKRAQMVSLLHDYLQYCGEDASASEIMDIIEEAGMQPPCRADYGGHGFLVEGDCDDHIESCDFTWETEDA